MPAFAGAVGHGAQTVAGGGGPTITVTTLADSGAGSLREAVARRGPRTVVFGVAGTIRLKSPLIVAEPFLTLTGAGAPGSGIRIRDCSVVVKTHDVLLRYIRSRPGPATVVGCPPGGRDALTLWASAPDRVYNIVVDHCSLTWAIDENLGTYGPIRDVTISNCIIAEGLRNSIHPDGAHSMGMLLGSRARRVTFLRNLFACNVARNPKLPFDVDAEVINNYVYGFVNQGVGVAEGSDYVSTAVRANIISNFFKKSPDTPAGKRGISFTDTRCGPGTFLKGNRGPGRATDDMPEWGIAEIKRGTAQDYRATTPKAAQSGIAVMPDATLAAPEVLAGAGATLPRRDAVDARIVAGVKAGTARVIDSPAQVGGYPVYG